MVLCPGALLIGCAKCPIVKACPGKEIIGNYKKDDKAKTKEKKPK
jgi:hypothetical protein